MSVLRNDQALVEYLADRLVELGDSVPADIPTFRLGTKGNPLNDAGCTTIGTIRPTCTPSPGKSGQPQRPGQVGRLGERLAPRNTAGRSSSPVGRPGRVHQHRRLRQGVWRLPRLRLVRARRNPEGALLPQGITEFANAGIMAGIATVNFSREPGEGVQRLLGRLLDLRLLLVPEVRLDAALQPACAGLRAQDRQGHLGGGPLRPRDGGRLPDALRHLLAGRDPALPGRPDRRPAPVGVQRGAGGARRRRCATARPSWPCT